MIGFILYSISYLLFLPFTFINYFNVKSGERKGYFINTAKNIDIFANREFRATWNKWLIVKSGVKFGTPGITISEILGWNQLYGTLTNAGWVLVYILDTIQKGHCFIAAGIDYEQEDRLIFKKIKKIWFNIKFYFYLCIQHFK